MQLTKEQLKQQLHELEQKEKEAREEKAKEDNYKKFQNRIDDLVIRKAHCDIGQQNEDYRWR